MYHKNIILCHRCFTPHKKLSLAPKEEARCVRCKALLYRHRAALDAILLALSSTALFLLLLANMAPLLRIDFGGLSSHALMLEAIFDLFDKGFVLISFFSLLVLEVFPWLLMGTLALFSFLALLGRGKEVAKVALVLVEILRRWSMLDIFFIAILVAMVKVYQYAQIHFGLAFWALGLFVAIEIYMMESIRIEELWDLWERRYAVA